MDTPQEGHNTQEQGGTSAGMLSPLFKIVGPNAAINDRPEAGQLQGILEVAY